MSQPMHSTSHEQKPLAGEMRIYGLYTTRTDARLWLARIDGPKRASVRRLWGWKLAAVTLIALLWTLAALLNSLAV